MENKPQAILPIILFFVVLFAGAYRDISSLLHFPIAVGVDGYYYVLQITELLNRGHLHFPSNTPLVLYFLAAISLLLRNPILAIKIGSLLLHAALCIGIRSLLLRAGCSRWLGLLGGSLVAFAGLRYYLIVEFISNLGAVTLLVVCGWCLLKALQNKSRYWAGASALCFVSAVFSHKSTLPVTFILVVLSLLIRPFLALRSSRLHTLAALLIIILLLIAPAIVAAQSLVELPAWFRLELSAQPHLPFGRVALAEKLTLLLVAPAILFLVSRLPRTTRLHPENYIFCVLALWSLLITLNPFLAYNLGWSGIAVRLSSLAYVQVAILVPGMLWMMLRFRPRALWYVGPVLALLFIFGATIERPSGLQPYYLFNREQVMTEIPRRRTELQPDPIIMAEHGTDFAIIYVSGITSQARLPQDYEHKAIYWLLFGLRADMLEPSMINLGQTAGGSYIALVTSEALKRDVALMSGSDRQRLFVINRHLYQACVSAGFSGGSRECTQVP